MRYVAALPGETTECVCHGLLQVFGHMGMAPRALVFDNATGVGHCNADGTVTQTRLFSLFSAHYGCRDQVSATRMRATRRAASRTRSGSCDGDLMVPEPAAEGWDALTRAWLDECDEIARREHYRQAAPIRDLSGDRSGSHAPVAGHAVRRMRLAERENGPYRHGPDRWQPVSRRSEMAFHAPPGRCQGPGHRDARPRRGIHRDAGTRMGPRATHRHGTDDAAGDHRAQAPDAGAGARSASTSPQTCATCPVRMDGRARADLLDDIRYASATNGFAAATRAVSAIIDEGRRIDRASIDQTARRIRQGGEDTAPGPDLSRYNTYMEERDDD